MNLTQEDVRAHLENLVTSGASELHLKVPNRPQLRMGKDLVPNTVDPLTPDLTLRFATLLCGLAKVELALAAVTHHEFSFGVQGLGRFHAILYRQRGTLAIQLRKLSFGAPSLQSLGFPSETDAVLSSPGLYLICGDRTRHVALGSLIATYNNTRRGLVVVVEDPLTTLHRDKLATIAQCDVGTDVNSIAEGVRGAIRQHADVIGVGDIPDRSAAEAVLCAAESGALVIACVPASEPGLAASWLLRNYSGDRDMDITNRVRRQLRGVLAAREGKDGQYVARRPGKVKQAA